MARLTWSLLGLLLLAVAALGAWRSFAESEAALGGADPRAWLSWSLLLVALPLGGVAYSLWRALAPRRTQ